MQETEKTLHTPAKTRPRGGPLAAAKRALARLPRMEDEAQRRAGANILRFVAALVLLTLIARGAAGATTPPVQTGTLTSGEIVQKTSAVGRVQSAGSESIELPAGLTVGQVYVAAGQTISEGEALARFDVDEVNSLLAREQNQLDKLRQELGVLEQGQSYDASPLRAAETALARAKEDYATTKTDAQAATQAAESALAAAKQEQNDAQTALDGLPADADTETRTAAEGRLASAKTATATAQEGLSAAQGDATAQLREAQRRVDDAETALAAAKQADSEGRRDAGNTQSANRIAADALRLDIAEQSEKVEALARLAQNEGVLYAPLAGTVASAAESGTDTAGPIITLEQAADGYIAEASLPAAEARGLVSGADVEVETDSGTYSATTVTGTLLSVSDPDVNGEVILRIRLPQGSWKSGESLPISITRSRQAYNTVVPLSALHANSTGYYVLAVIQSNGVLGEVYTLREVPVEVKAKDGSYAAIEAPLGYDDLIVTGSGKPVAEGDRVRLEA